MVDTRKRAQRIFGKIRTGKTKKPGGKPVQVPPIPHGSPWLCLSCVGTLWYNHTSF